MKIDLSIHLVGGDKSSKKVGRVEVRRFGRPLFSSETEVVARESSDTQELSEKQILAYQVRDRNSELSIRFGQGDVDLPPSLSANLQKPAGDFETVMNNLSQNPQVFLAAHEDLNRQQATDLLLKAI